MFAEMSATTAAVNRMIPAADSRRDKTNVI
jgi:hypothetical protein